MCSKIRTGKIDKPISVINQYLACSDQNKIWHSDSTQRVLSFATKRIKIERILAELWPKIDIFCPRFWPHPFDHFPCFNFHKISVIRQISSSGTSKFERYREYNKIIKLSILYQIMDPKINQRFIFKTVKQLCNYAHTAVSTRTRSNE